MKKSGLADSLGNFLSYLIFLLIAVIGLNYVLSEIAAGIVTVETLKSYIGMTRIEIPYDIDPALNGNGFETDKNLRMYGHKGKVFFEFENSVVINAYWVSGDVKRDEIDGIIRDISKITGLHVQEFYEGYLQWTNTSDNIEYYSIYPLHEGSSTSIGVRRL